MACTDCGKLRCTGRNEASTDVKDCETPKELWSNNDAERKELPSGDDVVTPKKRRSRKNECK